MNEKQTKKIFLVAGMLLAPCLLNAMSLGMLRDMRDGQFQPALVDAAKNGITVNNLTKACAVIQTSGIASYANYFSEFYVPFVNTFGGAPELVCSQLNTIPNVQGAIAKALPLRGGTITAQTEQTALKAVQDFIKKGGSQRLFLSDVDMLLDKLVIGAGSGSSGGASTPVNQDADVVAIATNLSPFYSQNALLDSTTTANMKNLVQFSTDIKNFLQGLPNTLGTSSSNFATWSKNISDALKNPTTAAKATTSDTNSSGAGLDANMIAIANALIQQGTSDYPSEDAFTNGTTITDTAAFAAKVKELNDPADDLSNPASAFGLFATQVARYTGGDVASSSYGSYPTIGDWAANIYGIMDDANKGYEKMAEFAESLPGFTYDPANDYLENVIQNLVNAAQGGGGGGSGAESSDSNMIAIANALIQQGTSDYPSEDAFTNGTTITDTAAFAAKVKELNDPADDLSNPASAFGLFATQVARYTGGDVASSSYGSYPTIGDWAANIYGIMDDANKGYEKMAEFAESLSGFTYDPASDYLEDVIQNLVNAAQGGGGTNDGGNYLSDQNLVAIGKALSGINGNPESKDSYLSADGKSLDPRKLQAMSNFATELRATLDYWQGMPADPSEDEDPNMVASPTLCFKKQTFENYKYAMNGAVADETDILGYLPDLFASIGDNYPWAGTLTYDISKLPHENIYGSADNVDENGYTIPNPNGLFAFLQNAFGSENDGQQSTGPTLSLGESLNAMGTMLADQIQNHNATVTFIAGRCLAMKKAFTEAAQSSSPINLINGNNSYTVTGATGQSTTRTIAQEVFHDVVNAEQNGMLSYLNNQALNLQKQAKELKKAGATFAATNGEIQTAINAFDHTTVTVAQENTGTMDVTTKTLTF